jgi:UDP-N-acetylglucosamine--N-acetylmuramyl-(pentapeptide) pyrophosphoryl-undecaprenol N-acetylglucosamine transferase
MLRGLNLLIAGGGTGGHLFPGIAIAKALMAKNPKNRVLFVGTDKPFEKNALSNAGFDHEAITAEGVKGRGFWQQITALRKIPTGIAQSLVIIHKFKPDIALGVGGYSSGPVLMAAWLMNVPLVLQEQNILPGITNRILAFFSQRIYLSYEHSRRCFNGFFQRKLRDMGNPVREDVLKKCNMQHTTCKTDSFTVLILGGSQGAHAINLAVIKAIEHIREKEKFFFIHQTGAPDEAMVKDAYDRHGMNCMVSAFFEDMGKQYHEADMIICRAGATTVAEITAIGKLAILIPYPFAADNHQVLNAKMLADRRAAEMILEKDLNAQLLVQKIEYYAEHWEIAGRMAANAKDMGKPDAAKAIVEDFYEILGR